MPTWRMVKPGEEAIERAVLRSLERGDEVLRRFLAHPLEAGQGCLVEPVEVGEAVNQAAVDELVDELGPQAVDVHRVAVGEPANPLLELLGAVRGRVRAMEIDLAGFAGDRRLRSSGKWWGT